MSRPPKWTVKVTFLLTLNFQQDVSGEDIVLGFIFALSSHVTVHVTVAVPYLGPTRNHFSARVVTLFSTSHEATIRSSRKGHTLCLENFNKFILEDAYSRH